MPAATPAMLRFAGLLYIVIIAAGITAELAIRAPILAAGSAEDVAAAIAAAPGLFGLSVVLDAVMALSDVALAVLLFLILRPLGAGLALGAMVFRLIQAAVIAAALVLPASTLIPGLGLPALTLLQMHATAYDMGLVFFAVNSVLTGLLLMRVGGVARVIGVAIILSGAVYLAGSILRLLAPEALALFQPAYLLPVLAETSFAVWLLMAGGHAGRRALAMAG